jgi:hypothetical protein
VLIESRTKGNVGNFDIAMDEIDGMDNFEIFANFLFYIILIVYLNWFALFHCEKCFILRYYNIVAKYFR